MSEFRHVASYSKKKMKLCPSIMCLKGILKLLCKSDENKEEIVLTRHTVTKSKINPTLRGGGVPPPKFYHLIFGALTYLEAIYKK